MSENTNIGCGACHALPANEWCDFHERTLRPRMIEADPLAHLVGQFQVSADTGFGEHRVGTYMTRAIAERAADAINADTVGCSTHRVRIDQWNARATDGKVVLFPIAGYHFGVKVTDGGGIMSEPTPIIGFSPDELVDAADRRCQRASGERYRIVSRRKADAIWATLTEVQRQAAIIMWRECS